MTTEHQSQTQPLSFGTDADADLAARLAAPVSPTTEKSAAEAARRTSEWPKGPQRTFSFDHQEYKRAQMAASGALSGSGPAAAPGDAAAGFTERT